MSKNQTKGSSETTVQASDHAIGMVEPTDPSYRNTRFLSGVMVDNENNEHDIQLVRRGDNGNATYDVLYGLQRRAPKWGELVPVNGHLEGTIGNKNPRKVGGIFRSGGRIMIIPGDKIVSKPRARRKSLAEMLTEAESAPASVAAEVEDANIPF